MNAVRLFAIQSIDGTYLLLTPYFQVIDKLPITNPTANDLQVFANKHYPNIPAAEWYVIYHDDHRRFEITYSGY